MYVYVAILVEAFASLPSLRVRVFRPSVRPRRGASFFREPLSVKGYRTDGRTDRRDGVIFPFLALVRLLGRLFSVGKVMAKNNTLAGRRPAEDSQTPKKGTRI